MKFWKAGLAVSAVLSLAGVGTAANAASITYDWTVSAFGTSGEVAPGSGTITVTSETSGKDPITGITGAIDGTMITGVGASSGANNFLYPNGAPTVLDTVGFNFTTPTGTGSIFSFDAQGSTVSPGDVNLDGFSGLPGGFVVGNFNIAPVPLPASWTVLLLGVCGLGFLATRKKQAGGRLMGFTAA